MTAMTRDHGDVGDPHTCGLKYLERRFHSLFTNRLSHFHFRQLACIVTLLLSSFARKDKTGHALVSVMGD